MVASRFTYTALTAMALMATAWSQPAGRGVISGAVVEGESNDAIRKAIVTLTLQGTPRRWATARTDSSGRFQFENLPAGKYDLRALKAGEGSAIYGANSPRELSELITLAEGQTLNGFILRFLRRGSISGHVYDSSGEPVNGVNVFLLRRGRNLGAPIFINNRVATTNDQGEYRITNVDTGQYFFRTMPAAGYGGQYYGGASDAKDAIPVFLRGAENLAGVDFNLKPESAIQIHGRIIGVPEGSEPSPAQITNAQRPAMIGAGGAAVQVSIRRIQDGTVMGSVGTVAQRPEYRFEMKVLGAGRYRIDASVQFGKKSFGASQILDLDSNSPEIQLALVPAADIQGMLRFEGKAPDPQNRSGSPATGATRVQLFRPDTQEGSISAQVRPDGRFTLEQVLPGDWQLAVNPLPGFLKSARLGEKDILLTTFEFSGNGDTPLNIVASARTATLGGEVDAGSPASRRAGILLARVGQYHNLTRFYYFTAADDEGKFKLTGIAPGKYKLFAFEKLAATNFIAPEAADQLDDLGETIEFDEGAVLQAHPKLVPGDRAMKAVQ